MISVVLYGRNDSYGYNLHKRAALSLNCIAELLDAPNDEILFVDYNTPDDLPSFPEAIRDTLTPRARALLRILRLRPAQHRRFAARSHLVALEPVARNVAIRRANPENRWVLSTNTDMIFTPRDGRSLSAIAAQLPDGYYHLPRFELPETLWEMLDRADAPATIATVAAWGRRYHLDEIVTLPHPAIRYDGPGDFQLILREDLHRLHGFDERMLLGWHVDSNIAVRLALLHGGPRDLLGALSGYHCDHTRQVTPAHRPGAASNDWDTFVTNIKTPQAPDQPLWGLAGETLEEHRLDTDAALLAALDVAIPTARPSPTEVAYGANAAERDTDHTAPFVIDALCTAPPASILGWIGADPALLARIQAAWPRLGFTAPIRAALAAPDGTLPASAAIIDEADILVFDFSATPAIRANPASTMLDDPPLAALAASFRRAIAAERRRTRPPRRIIAVNAVAQGIAPLIAGLLGAPQAPFSTRLRQGFALPAPPPTLVMHPTAIGHRADPGIRIAPFRRGLAIVCSATDLPPGHWTATLHFQPDLAPPLPAGPLKLEALRGPTVLAHRYLLANGLLPQRLRLDFALPDPTDLHDVTIRLHTIGLVHGRITAATLTPRPPPKPT